MAAVNGVELFVRRFGDRSLPVLIVIHGGPTWDHSYLLPAVAQLAAVAPVAVFALPACGRCRRPPPAGRLPTSALQPDYLSDDVAALADWLGAGQVDVLGFSYGGGIAMRVAGQHPRLVRRPILPSAAATGDFTGELKASPDYRERRALCAPVNVDELASPDAADGALSRAMAYADAPVSIWRLDRLAEWHAVLAQVRFSSDWNEPYAAGTLRPAAPDDPDGVLRRWGGPLLIVHGQRELGFPIGVARWLH